MKAFICYHRATGSTFATWLQAKWQAHFGKRAVFLDTSADDLSNDFRVDVAKALARCDVLLFVATKGSLASRECHNEVSQAAGRRKTVIICEFESSLEYPSDYADFHRVDFVTNFDLGWHRLSNSLKLPNRPRYQAAILVGTLLLGFLLGVLTGTHVLRNSQVSTTPPAGSTDTPDEGSHADTPADPKAFKPIEIARSSKGHPLPDPLLSTSLQQDATLFQKHCVDNFDELNDPERIFLSRWVLKSGFNLTTDPGSGITTLSLFDVQTNRLTVRFKFYFDIQRGFVNYNEEFVTKMKEINDKFQSETKTRDVTLPHVNEKWADAITGVTPHLNDLAKIGFEYRMRNQSK